MRIAIDNRAVIRSGMGNYSAILLSLLPEMDEEIKVLTYEDGLIVDRKGFVHKYVNLLRRVLGDQFTLPGWGSLNRIDILHNPRNMGIPFYHSFKVVTTIHDIIPHVFPQFYLSNFIERIYYEFMIRLSFPAS